MDEILTRSLQGKATPAESQRVRRWRDADPEHELHWQELQRVWAAVSPLEEKAVGRPRPSAFEIVRAASLRRREVRQARSRRWNRWATRAAAAAALLVVGFGAAMMQRPQPLLAGGVVTTSAEEMATVSLADGSLVRLGPNSEFRFGDGLGEREVWLEGEAFFSVAPMRDRPFTVRTTAATAVALGTRFGVLTREDSMEVRVIEGLVALSTNGVSREISGGEVGHVVNKSLSVRRAGTPDELRSNLGNFLAFRSTPLSTVVEEVSAHFGRPTAIEDESLARQTVTASFQDATYPEVVSVICRITASRCTVDGTGATIGAAVAE
jgi:transmembrane sensor